MPRKLIAIKCLKCGDTTNISTNDHLTKDELKKRGYLPVDQMVDRYIAGRCQNVEGSPLGGIVCGGRLMRDKG